MNELVHIGTVMTACIATFGVFQLVLRRNGITYTDHYLVTAAYFLFIAVGLTWAYWSYIEPLLLPILPAPLVVLAGFMLLQTLWYVYSPTRKQEPIDYFRKYPDRYYLKIHWKRLVSKSFDILAQQVFIVLLVLMLRELGLTLVQTTIAFTFLFALLHLPLIVGEFGRWPSALFGGAVLGFGLTFPMIILLVPYGFVYTYIIHWLFYTVTASVFWIRYAKRRQ